MCRFFIPRFCCRRAAPTCWVLPRIRSSTSRLTFEIDADGKPTGWISGDNRAISDVFNLLPRPNFSQQVAGTRAFFRALNALGITGVLDPGGYNMPIEEYRPLFQVWRDRAMTVRVAYSLCAPRRGHELEDLQAMTDAMPMGFGDEWLRFNGIGENVVWGMYNNEKPTDADREQPLPLAAMGGAARADRDVPLAQRELGASSAWTCWSASTARRRSRRCAGRSRISTTPRPTASSALKAMGMGWLMQNAFYFRGEAFLGQRGAEARAALAADRKCAAHGPSGRRRHRRASRDELQSVRLAAMDARRQDRRRHADARA